MSNTIYAVISESEDLNFSEIDLVEHMIDGVVLYFRSVQDLLFYNDNDEDISDCKVFVLGVTSKGLVKNNPKFVTVEEIKQSNKSPKK